MQRTEFHAVPGGNSWLALLVLGFCVLLPACQDSAADVVRHQNAGDDAYIHGNYSEAEREYQVALSKAQKADGTNVLTIICLRSLAQVYIAQGKTTEAESIYRKRIELLTEHPTDPNYASTVYDDLATFYILNGRVVEAKPVYYQAIALIESTYGTDNPKVGEKVEYYVALLKVRNYQKEALELQTVGTAAKQKQL